MYKSGELGLLKVISFIEIFILIFMSFSFSFFMNLSFVSGLSPATNPADYTGPRYGDVDYKTPIDPKTGIPLGAGAPPKDPFATNSYKAFDIVDTGLTGVTAHLAQGLVWAGVVYFGAKTIGSLLGLSDKNSNALGIAGVAGVLTYKAIEIARINDVGFFKEGLLSQPLIPAIAVAAVVFILMYSKEKKKLVQFQCLPFEPPTGGAKCEECNKDIFRPCSEYRCKALGQACELLNKGNIGKEYCAWVNPKDVSSPTITPWTAVLFPRELKYITDTSIRPPALGVRIVKDSNGCIAPFTPLKFGVLTNEPAQCKIDYNHTNKFDDMQYFFGGSNYYEYNHTQTMRLPAPVTENDTTLPLLQNDGTFSLYVRCRDANGNENVDEYSVRFCVDKSPDTTPPVIEQTSITSGSPIRFGSDSTPIDVYTNEPAECKWSRQDKAFEDMENNMLCSNEERIINGDTLFGCNSNLTGIENRKSSTFYFRCKDQPDKEDKDRNVMLQSYPLILRGSEELNIIKTAPNGTIYGSTNSISIELNVETSNGADEGKALCYFSTSPAVETFIPMFQTDSYTHSQQLNLGGGNYTYYFRCIDSGGNADINSTSFNLIVDQKAPIITRIYKEEPDALKLVTNEDAECSYSLQSCNFNVDAGIKLIYSNGNNKRNLFAEWKPTIIYYIKCKDVYGNEPSPTACSIVASAQEISAR